MEGRIDPLGVVEGYLGYRGREESVLEDEILDGVAYGLLQHGGKGSQVDVSTHPDGELDETQGTCAFHHKEERSFYFSRNSTKLLHNITTCC